MTSLRQTSFGAAAALATTLSTTALAPSSDASIISSQISPTGFTISNFDEIGNDGVADRINVTGDIALGAGLESGGINPGDIASIDLNFDLTAIDVLPFPQAGLVLDSASGTITVLTDTESEAIPVSVTTVSIQNNETGGIDGTAFTFGPDDVPSNDFSITSFGFDGNGSSDTLATDGLAEGVTALFSGEFPDASLAVGQNGDVVRFDLVVPEPGTALLLAPAVLALLSRRRHNNGEYTHAPPSRTLDA